MAEQKPLGIYSTKNVSYIGSGMTRRKSVSKRYWYVWDLDDDFVEIQPLNQNLIPTGEKRRVDKGELQQNYQHEPDFYVDPGSSKVKPVWQQALSGDRAKAKTEPKEGGRQLEVPSREALDLGGDMFPQIGEEPPEDAPDEAPSRAKAAEPVPPVERDAEDYDDDPMAEVEKSARMDFGMGVTYLKTGNRRKAIKIFEELAEIEGDFETRHKHMFNDFGVGLRKSKLLDLSLKHYMRALDLSPADENLHVNIARIYFEKGDNRKATEHLQKSLELNPDLKVSEKFLNHIKKQQRKKGPLKLGI